MSDNCLYLSLILYSYLSRSSWFEVHKGNLSHLCCLLWMINSIETIHLFHDQQPMYILKCFSFLSGYTRHKGVKFDNSMHLRFSFLPPFLNIMNEVVSSSSLCSNIGCRFRPRLGLLSAAAVCKGAAVLLLCAALLLVLQ